MERTKIPKLRNGSKGDSNPGLFDCESGVPPLSVNVSELTHSLSSRIPDVTPSSSAVGRFGPCSVHDTWTEHAACIFKVHFVMFSVRVYVSHPFVTIGNM